MTAGAAWWVGLLCWQWGRHGVLPAPAVLRPFDALDLVTLPTLVAALAHAAVRSRRERTMEARAHG